MFGIFSKQQGQTGSNQGQPNNQGQAPANQGQQGTDQGTPTNGVLKGMSTPDGNPAKTENPLDAFSGMFDNTNNEKPDLPPSFSIPQEALTKVASSLDFTRDVSPDLMAKVRTGDVGAVIELVNEVGRRAYMTSLQHTSGLSNEFVNSRLAHEQKGLGGLVKEHLTTSELNKTTTSFSHPVVKEQLVMVAKQLQKQFPDAAPEKIAAMSKQYITDLASALNTTPDTNTDSNAGATGETDWGKVLGF